MAAYTYTYPTATSNFSSGSTEIYRLDVNVTATAVVGGMKLAVSSTATMFSQPGGVTPAFSSNGSRTYSVPNGRTSSTSGSLLTSGSASWSYDFGANYTQNVWSGFNRYIASGAASTASVTITATGSGSTYLQTASTTRSGISLSIPYALNYSANGGSGSVSSTTTSSTSDSVSLTAASGSGLSRSGYTFTGWNTASNGSGTSVSAGSSFTLTGYSNYQQTLYAQWELSDITVYFDYQGGSGPQASKTFTVDTAIGTLPTPYTYTGSTGNYQFIGWYTSTNGGGSQIYSSTVFNTGDTLYAYWESTVVFNANGGTGGATLGVPKGNTVNPASYSAGTRTGYTFNGWFTSTSGGTQYSSTFTPTGSFTLYAQWTANAVSWSDNTLTLTARKGTSYSSTVSASYVAGWNDGILPSKGLSFTQGTSTTGSSTSTLSGTPNDYGDLTFTLTPYNADFVNGTAYTYTIAIADVALSWSDQILATSTVTQNQSYTDGVSVAAGPTTTYSVQSGSLPTGVTLNSSTGVISGTPTTPGSYSFVIRATNGTGETLDTSTLSITVEAAGGFAKVWNGTAWVEGTAYAWNGAAWVEGTIKVRGASSWTDSFSS